MKKLVALAALCIAATGAHALDRIVAVSGQDAVCNGCLWAPLGVMLDAGNYTITPVLAGSAPGAIYTAYNFGMGLGWSAAWGLGLDPTHITDYGTSGPHAGAGWPDEATAFAHTAAGSLTLSTAQVVYFGVPDSYYGDNSGGVSLHIRPVPEPDVAGLLLGGLAALGWVFRRRAGITGRS